VYTPVNGQNPATDVIYTADYGLTWGFQIVPEPSSIVLIVLGSGTIAAVALRRRKSTTGSSAP
jgi:PEP-CTERM motif